MRMSAFLRGDVMIAFAVMTAVTVASRLGGYWMMGYVTVTPRVRRMLDALPGSIIVAAALPVAVNGGAVVMFAIASAMLVTIIRRNDFIAVITGMAVAALARAMGFSG
jgi:branched chain amino acid efflux pump